MPIAPFTGFYIDEAKNLANQECLNLFPVLIETKGPMNPQALRSPAGLVEFSPDAGEGPCRGMIRLEDELYTVHGDRFYKVDAAGVKTALGDVVVGSGRVHMSENGFVITVVVPGEVEGYFYDKALDTFTEIADPVFIDYGNKLDVAYIDGYFVYLTDKEFFLSSLVTDNHGQNFDGLDFSTADYSTDNNVAVEVVKGELYIFGLNSIEVFSNTADTFPFTRIPGAAIDRGLSSSFAVIDFQNTYLFLGAGENEGISIWSGLSGQSERISTPSIDNILQGLPRDDLANAYAFKYSESGNFFCCFTVPNQITLVYDQTSSQKFGKHVWHRRSSSTTAAGVSRVSHFEQVYGQIMAGDSVDGRLGQVDLETFTEYGNLLLRRFNTVYVKNNSDRFSIPFVELKSQVGLSGFNPAQVGPDLSMALSVDGGINFFPFQTLAMPSEPSGLTRTVFKQLGRFEFSAVMQFDVLTDQKIAHTLHNIVGGP